MKTNEPNTNIIDSLDKIANMARMWQSAKDAVTADRVGGVLATAGIIAGTGALVEGMTGVGKAAIGMVAREAAFRKMLNRADDLQRYPEPKVKAIFNAMWKVHPALAMEPTISASFVREHVATAHSAPDITVQSISSITPKQDKKRLVHESTMKGVENSARPIDEEPSAFSNLMARGQSDPSMFENF